MSDDAFHPAAGTPGLDETLALTDLLRPDTVRIWRDAHHVLHLAVGEREFEGLRPVRAFPLSAKADYVSFLDARGKEVALVADVHRLDRESRETLDHALERLYYVPRILRVDSIRETLGVSHWQAQTDRGYVCFEVIDRDFILKLTDGRLLISDADGNRYEIPDVEALDAHSQTLLESET